MVGIMTMPSIRPSPRSPHESTAKCLNIQYEDAYGNILYSKIWIPTFSCPDKGSPFCVTEDTKTTHDYILPTIEKNWQYAAIEPHGGTQDTPQVTCPNRPIDTEMEGEAFDVKCGCEMHAKSDSSLCTPLDANFDVSQDLPCCSRSFSGPSSSETSCSHLPSILYNARPGDTQKVVVRT